jgi:hypothetical protein
MADKPSTEKKIKVNAAKTTDSAADEGASLAGAKHEAPPPGASGEKGKLLPKNKHRLPRRQKKAEQKAATHL